MFAALLSIVPTLIGGVSDHLKDKRELNKIEATSKLQLKSVSLQS